MGDYKQKWPLDEKGKKKSQQTWLEKISSVILGMYSL